MRLTSFARAALGAATLAAIGTIASCEFVLGDLPPVGATSSSTTGTVSTTSGATSTSSAAGSGTSSGSDDGGCCDCDGDGVKAEGMCGGQDCDDHDDLVYPGEPTYYATPASPAIGFDYDCSGEPDRNPAQNVTVNCGALGLPCSSSEGYLGMTPPACGVGAAWGTCKQEGVGCVNDVIDAARVMTCK